MDDCKPNRLKNGLRTLGLERYHDDFVNNGFDSWEALTSVTESDLETVGLKLGHRRKLQRAFNQNTNDASSSSGAHNEYDTVRPRIYRRHPRPDRNAPPRPLTAYVRFSNNQREVYKDKQWSFTDLTRQIGLDWRTLQSGERQKYVDAAEAAKAEYRQELSTYRQTDEYREYSAYLEDFTRRNPRTSHTRQSIPSSSISRIPRADLQAEPMRRASTKHTADTTPQSIEIDTETVSGASPDQSNMSGSLIPSPLETGPFDEFHDGLYVDASPPYASLEASPLDAPMLNFEPASETMFAQQMYAWPHDAHLPLNYLHSNPVWPNHLDYLDSDGHV